MADFGRGIKAGIVASIIYSLPYGLVLLAIPAIILGGTGSPFWESYGTIIMLVTVVSAIVGGIVFGVVWGVIYAAAYDSLPSSSPIIKGIILGIAYWLVTDVVFTLAFAGSIVYLVFSFILGALLFGSLLGLFWRVFGGPGK
jgi:hypothetical protein